MNRCTWECTRCQAKVLGHPMVEPLRWKWRLWFVSAGPNKGTPYVWKIVCAPCDAKAPAKKHPDPPQEGPRQPW